jgi:hypothetical protein
MNVLSFPFGSRFGWAWRYLGWAKAFEVFGFAYAVGMGVGMIPVLKGLQPAVMDER